MADLEQAQPLYDMERGLREIARHRLKRDALTAGQVHIGDRLAEHLCRHFAPEEIETAGRALMIAASAQASLVADGVTQATVILNIIGFAAGRMVTDGRAWTDAQEVPGG